MDSIGQLYYFVVENDCSVCEGIIERMGVFPGWTPMGYTTGVSQAIEVCTGQRPHLLFLDWSLAGGSAYEVLDAIRSIPDYDPYIICFTGYQSDNPDVPMVLINRYRVDNYIIKPIWAHLREGLPRFLEEARAKYTEAGAGAHSQKSWLKDTHGTLHHLDMSLFAAACTAPEDARCKLLYFFGKKDPVCLRQSWQQVTTLLEQEGVDYYMPNARTQLVARPFIERYQPPNIYMRGVPCRFEVVNERAKEFEAWMLEGS